MKLFKAVFARWINEEDVYLVSTKEELEKALAEDCVFLIEVPTLEQAKAVAQSYVGLEANSYEGIGELKSVDEISKEEAKQLTPITIYRDQLLKIASANRKLLASSAIKKAVVEITKLKIDPESDEALDILQKHIQTARGV